MPREIDPFVYLLASRKNGTLYLGVTSNLMQRIAQHRAETFGGFTTQHSDGAGDHSREAHQERRRAWKVELIEQTNPEWGDLAVGLGFDPLR